MVSLIIRNKLLEQLDVITDTSNRGGTFELSANFDTFGGFTTAKIVLTRYANLVIGNNLPCDVYYQGELLFTGFVDSFTDPSTVSETLTINIKSVWERLKKLKYTATFTDVTLDDVIDDIYDYLYAMGLVTCINKEKDYTVIPIVQLIYDEKPFDEVMSQLLQLVNNEYEQHSIFIDKNKCFNLVVVDTEDKDYLFQNSDYQEGTYKPVPPVANKLAVFTTLSVAGINKQILLSTLTNEISREAYGDYEESVVFSNEIDDATALMMGTAILKYSSQNGFDITLKDITSRCCLDFKKYVIQTERYSARYAIEGGTSVSQWDVSNLLATVASVNREKYFTGNQSLQLTLDTGSTGEEVEYKSGYLTGVSQVVVTYQTTGGGSGRLIATDSVGNQLFFNLTSPDSWSTITIQPTSGTEDYHLRVNDGTTDYLLEVAHDDGGGVDNYNLKVTAAAILNDIHSIVIRMTEDTGDIYIDQLGVKGDTIGYYEEIISGYSLKNVGGQLIVDKARFGNKEQTPIEQLGNTIKRTDILYNNLASEG